MALQITRPRTTLKFYPDQGVAAKIDAAQTALDEALAAEDKVLKDPKRTMASRAVGEAAKAVKAAEKALDETKESAAATVLDLTLEALSRKRWAEAEEAHPVRKGDRLDEMYSVNWDTFLGEVLPVSVAEVRDHAGELVEVAPEEWAAAVDEITDGQYQVLMVAVLTLNRNAQAPF